MKSILKKGTAALVLITAIACDDGVGSSIENSRDTGTDTDTTENTTTDVDSESESDSGADSESESDTTNNSCSASADALCEAWGILENRCDGPVDTDAFVVECMSMFTVEGKPFDCGFVASAADCMNPLECSSPDDPWEGCVMKGMLATEPEGWDVAQVESLLNGTYDTDSDWTIPFGGVTGQCLDRYTECDTGGVMSFWDDECITIAALSAANQVAIQKCFPLACDDVGDCMRTFGVFSY